jgi:hypothetical protein
MLTPEIFGLIAMVWLGVILFAIVSVALRLIEMRSRMGGCSTKSKPSSISC